MRLSDGRQLSFADLGPREAPVVFYLHGNPGSRLDCASERYQRALAEAGVRLVAPDRPGGGGSDPISGPRHAKCAADVAELATHLGIDRFAVLGYSRGSLYALACGAVLPDRVVAVGILSGVAPRDMPGRRRDQRRAVRAFNLLTLRAPAIARVSARGSTRRAQRSLAASMREVALMLASPVDRRVLDAEGEGWHRSFLEMTRQDPCIQVVERRSELMEPLDFRLEDIAAPVLVWHGEDDRLVPSSHGRHIAERIPGARFTALPGHAHLHTPELISRIVRELAQAEERPSAPLPAEN